MRAALTAASCPNDGSSSDAQRAPELEIVHVLDKHSVKIWSHGYPFRTVRWHFHPEYEIHLVTHTKGIRYVGDHIGKFAVGDLVMVGPNLPHNWMSDVSPDTIVDERCLVLQFTEASIRRCVEAFPEMQVVEQLLHEAQRGLIFAAAVGRRVEPIMRQMMKASGPAQVSLFLLVLDELVRDNSRIGLVSQTFRPNPQAYFSDPVNRALHYVSERLTEEINESDVARHCGQSVSAFSKSFHRQTGAVFVQFVNARRVELACQHLTQDALSITEICYEVGFKNVSNFNRQFAAIKGMTPSDLRRSFRRRSQR